MVSGRGKKNSQSTKQCDTCWELQTTSSVHACIICYIGGEEINTMPYLISSTIVFSVVRQKFAFKWRNHSSKIPIQA